MTLKIIYSTPEGDIAVVHPTGEISDMTKLALQVVPDGLAYEIVDETTIPSDRTFRSAWIQDTPGHIDVDITKAREIGHQIRRNKRSEEFAPYDDVISKRIPGVSFEEAESKRQEIRDRYEDIQIAIDTAIDTSTIKSELGI